ncbi:helix-turn-helix transcriptional regulator [Ruminococcus sp. NK3A76]|uniref:helix-turn-helix domain-containing protein n=1 Tax=Ruminococcus sp. NK3A76 TaxID=877411 RepID=UPI00068FB688|nr:helix-turn-helix transcriptional regulator [Ruminococcus sp. NK3A76]
MEFKDALYYWRKKKNTSKYRLSDLSGISVAHLRNLENGIKQPNFSTIVIIADALNLSLAEFFNIDDSGMLYYSEKDKKLIELFRRMSKDKGQLLLDYIEKALDLEEEIKS